MNPFTNIVRMIVEVLPEKPKRIRKPQYKIKRPTALMQKIDTQVECLQKYLERTI
jgi:hypothetical protein